MTHIPAPDPAPLPPDDLDRKLTVGRADDDALPHIGLAGDSYTILVSGEDTGGQFTLIDMLVPPGGGPPPHRHDFEETFTVLEGAIDVTFRGETMTLSAGQTANIPANAPHRFVNAGDATAHLLCTCSPAGQDAFFLQVGDRLPSRDAHAPKPSDDELAARGAKVAELAPLYRTEFLA